MYLTKNELRFIAFLVSGWGGGFEESTLWDDLSEEQLKKVQWIFDGKFSLEHKLKDAGYTNDSVVDQMDLPEELKDQFR
ncbi:MULTISPECIES: hypothetical protein [unclassified Enterococcus]|uniref:hypothetical protein n=1 Tax=unclassified Enterococcus TaxID=2608891 RepID=UPI003D2BC6B1